MSRQQSGWEVLRKRDAGSTRWVGLEVWTVRHCSGHPPQPVDFQIILEEDAIHVVGRANNGDALLIVEDQVASGPGLLAISGRIETGQTPEDAALQEFVQESGWKPRTLVPLGTIAVATHRWASRTPGNDGAKTDHMFLALGLTRDTQRLEPTEKIQPVFLPWGEAVHAAYTGEVVPSVEAPFLEAGSRLMVILADRWLRTHGRG